MHDHGDVGREAGLACDAPDVVAETIRRAAAVHPICDLQIEYSLISRGIEGEILDTCRELGIGVTAYGVLSRGLISGHWTANRESGADDFRARSPRFSGENLDRNLALVEEVKAHAAAERCTPAQLAIAWVLSRRPFIVRRPSTNSAWRALTPSITIATAK